MIYLAVSVKLFLRDSLRFKNCFLFWSRGYVAFQPELALATKAGDKHKEF
jgi:hypothetical protein